MSRSRINPGSVDTCNNDNNFCRLVNKNCFSDFLSNFLKGRPQSELSK